MHPNIPSELVLVIKFGLELFSHTQISKVKLFVFIDRKIRLTGTNGSSKRKFDIILDLNYVRVKSDKYLLNRMVINSKAPKVN